MGEAIGDGRSKRRPFAEQPAELEHRLAAVDRARGVQHRVVELVDLGELPLARRRIKVGVVLHRAEALGPLAKALGGDPCRLQRVDPIDDPGEEPGGVPADLVPAQGQLVEPLEQQRQPLGGGQRLEEGVESCLGRVLVQQPSRNQRVRIHHQLLERALDRILGSGSDSGGGGLRAGQHERVLTGLRQVGEAAADRLGSPRSGQSEDEQRPIGMGDDALLRVGERRGP